MSTPVATAPEANAPAIASPAQTLSLPPTSLSDSLPGSVPKLDSSGLNWAIFSVRFQDAVEAKGFWGHFDGSEVCPTAVIPDDPTGDETTKINQWKKNERSAKSLLTQKLPDSALMRVHMKPTVKDRWDAITSEFTEKGAFAQTEMRAKFLGMKCPEKGNVHEFLDGVRVKREELATMGVKIDDHDYRSTIISSLPISLANFASNQLASARLYAANKTIVPDALIQMIAEESDRQRAQRAAWHRPPKRENPGEAKDEALAATPGTSVGQDRRGKPRKPKGVCWNCGEPGHFKHKCPKPQKDNSPGTRVTANVAVDSEDEAAFFMEPADEMDMDDVPVTSDHTESYEDESGWFSDASESAKSGWTTEELSRVDWSETSSLVDVDLDSVTAEVEVAAQINQDEGTSVKLTEIIDSGCTRHLTPNRDNLTNYVEIMPKSFRAADKRNMTAIGKGDMSVNIPNGDGMSKLRLTDVLYSPEVGYTLVSVGRLDDDGYTVTFGGGKCEIQALDGQVIGSVPKTSRGLYKLTQEVSDEAANAAVEVLTLDQLHRRMGHISAGAARQLVDKALVTGVKLDEKLGAEFFCESCVYAKATRKPVAKAREGECATSFGDEVHSDLWGPAPVETKGGRKYYVSFTDDATRFTHLYLLRAKSDTFDAYQKYEAWCNTQLDARVKILHSDRGGEYMDNKFIEHLKKRGTEQKLTVHDTPAHNGVAERRNRTILERIRALLHASGLPKNLWGEAARHVVWLMNRTSTKAVEGKMPFEAVFGIKPDLRAVHEWGEKVFVRVEEGNKLGGRVREGRWLGVDEQSKGARVYWPDKRSVTVERNVYYGPLDLSTMRNEGEDDIPAIPQINVPGPSNTPQNPPQPRVPTPPPIPEPVDQPEPEPEPEIETRSKRVRKPSQRILDIIEGRASTSRVPRGIQIPPPALEPVENRALEGEGQPEYMLTAENLDGYALAAETSYAEGLDPQSLAEVKRRSDWPLWESAIKEELALLETTGTYELTEAPPDANIVGSKWVFRIKKDAAGNAVRFKARLVAQGFSQVPGVDYFDTFAPVARLASIRSVFAMAARLDMELHQIDIKGAYLNGELTSRERIYMRQPPGYAQSPSSQVWRLRKTLYGLKQSGRRWYQRLCEIMMTHLRFSRCDVDMAVFYKREGDGTIIVLVHVDDCTIAASAVSLIVDFKTRIAEHVEITNLGELHWLLGIEIKRDRTRHIIGLSQHSYIQSILRRYGFDDLKPVSIPMDVNVRLTSSQSPSTTAEHAQMRDVPYHEAVGSAMYATIGTRPDISFAVQTVSRFSTNPGPAHWDAVKKIFRYLKSTKDLWLTYGGEKMDLKGYSDADGNMAKDRHAISGYAFLINGGAVSWSAK